MKLLFFGDSLTDACRNKEHENYNDRYGVGFVIQIVSRLLKDNPLSYEIINRGVGGNRIIDLYARIKEDVWNEKPDVITITEGFNDVSHEIYHNNGVSLPRWEKVYRMMIEDTIKVLPKAKIIVCEPYYLHGEIPDMDFEAFGAIKEYSKTLKKIAKDYNLYYLPLQDDLLKAVKAFGDRAVTYDGIHPTVYGATLIAEKWLELFKREKLGDN